MEKQTDLETFFLEAPQLNPLRFLIKGVICGVRVKDIEEPTMQEIRYLDKLIDELARGKSMETILRTWKTKKHWFQKGAVFLRFGLNVKNPFPDNSGKGLVNVEI